MKEMNKGLMYMGRDSQFVEDSIRRMIRQKGKDPSHKLDLDLMYQTLDVTTAKEKVILGDFVLIDRKETSKINLKNLEMLL